MRICVDYVRLGRWQWVGITWLEKPQTLDVCLRFCSFCLMLDNLKYASRLVLMEWALPNLVCKIPLRGKWFLCYCFLSCNEESIVLGSFITISSGLGQLVEWVLLCKFVVNTVFGYQICSEEKVRIKKSRTKDVLLFVLYFLSFTCREKGGKLNWIWTLLRRLTNYYSLLYSSLDPQFQVWKSYCFLLDIFPLKRLRRKQETFP